MGDPSVSYEDVDPSDGGPRTLLEHTEQRCRFHRFLTPGPGSHTLPGNANWLDKKPTNNPAGPRWMRSDI